MNQYPLHNVFYGTRKFNEAVGELCDLYFLGDLYLSMDECSQVWLEAVVEDDKLCNYLFKAHSSKGKKKHKIRLIIAEGQDLMIHLTIVKKKDFKYVTPKRYHEYI